MHWTGPVSFERLAREYSSAHAFCLPSAQEGFGMVFLEAMAAGLPIVAAHAAAIPEVVPHALFCEPGRVEEFAEAILRLHDSAALRAELAKAGKKLVERYDLPAVTEAFLKQIALC